MTDLVPPDQLENAIVVASLAHATARTPQQRREAWARLQALLKQKKG